MICLKFNVQNRPTDWQDRQTTSTTSSCYNQYWPKNTKSYLRIDHRLLNMVRIKVEETSNLEVGITKKIRKYEETKKYKNKMKIVEF